MNLLDYVMMMKEREETPTKLELSAIMADGSDEDKEKAWEKVYAAGGYDALEDE